MKGIRWNELIKYTITVSDESYNSPVSFVIKLYHQTVKISLVFKTTRLFFKIPAFAKFRFTSLGNFPEVFFATSYQVFKYCFESGLNFQNNFKVLFEIILFIDEKNI